MGDEQNSRQVILCRKRFWLFLFLETKHDPKPFNISSDWMITKLVELGKQKFGRRIRDNLESVDGKTLDDIMDASTKEAYMRLKPMSFT